MGSITKLDSSELLRLSRGRRFGSQWTDEVAISECRQSDLHSPTLQSSVGGLYVWFPSRVSSMKWKAEAISQAEERYGSAELGQGDSMPIDAEMWRQGKEISLSLPEKAVRRAHQI